MMQSKNLSFNEGQAKSCILFNRHRLIKLIFLSFKWKRYWLICLQRAKLKAPLTLLLSLKGKFTPSLPLLHLLSIYKELKQPCARLGEEAKSRTVINRRLLEEVIRGKANIRERVRERGGGTIDKCLEINQRWRHPEASS